MVCQHLFKFIPLCAVVLFVLSASPDPVAAQEPAGAEATETAAAVPAADKFVFRLKNGQEFTGFLGEKASITMIVADTNVEIPVYKIQQLKFDINKPGKAFVQLRDGDSITAQFVPGIAELTADWGKLSLNTDSLASMQMSK
jgi:hypothetical protein